MPLRHALALSPPYNFSTFVSTSSFKLFGGNILQTPNYVGLATQPGGDFMYGAMFQQFSSGANIWTNWIQPQIANFQRRGANHVRCILGGDYVLQGTITQTALNTAVNTMLTDIRSRGMTCNFDMMAVEFLSDIGSPTAAQQWVVSKSILDNCIVPNLDIVAYFQPSNQEARGADQTVADSVCGLMKAAGYTTPIGCNPFGGTFNNYTLANFDLMCIHNYIPQSTGNYYEGTRNIMTAALSGYAKKAQLEEFNVYPLTAPPNPQEMANSLEQALMAAFGLPDCTGATVWGGQSIQGQSDGDFSLYTVPGSYNPQAMDPSTVWTNNTAGTVYFNWASQNRNQSFLVSVNGTPTITTTLTAIQTNFTTPLQGQTLTNQGMGTNFHETVSISCNGTFAVSGTAGNTYRVSFGATNYNTSVWTEIGHVDVVGSGSANINTQGTLPAGTWVPAVQTQLVSGSTSGTLTAFNATIVYGIAPAPPNANATAH